jgi:putative membrane protein insertion efficiency factor
MKFVALALIRFYRICLSPLLPSFCRFYPTCSVYAYEAIERYGAWRGTRMALGRVLRCRPGGGYGYDPVPEEQVPDAGCRGPEGEGLRLIETESPAHDLSA